MSERGRTSDVEWRVYDPTTEREELRESEGPRLPELRGKKIGLLWNGKPGGDLVLDTLAGLLRDRFDGLRTERSTVFLSAGDEDIKRMAECDAVVSAIGD